MTLINIVVVGLLILQDLLLWLIGRYRFIDHARHPHFGEWPKVSILIPARNEEAVLPACLQSLEGIDYPEDKLQFIIGDDESTDKTPSIIKEWMASRSNGVWMSIDGSGRKELNGKAHALNQMAKLAEGELLLFTDADCTVNENWVREMVRAFRPSFGLVTGITTVRPSTGFAWMQSLDWWVTLGMVKGLSDLGHNVTAMGNNMLVSKQAYEEVGGFGQVSLSVTEDLALAQALTKRGYRPVQQVSPASLVETKSEKSFDALLKQRKRWMRGAMCLPWYWIMLLALQCGFFPAIIWVLFLNIWGGLGLWLLKIVVQSLFIKGIAARAGCSVRGLYLLLFEFYYLKVSWCTIVYYFWPSSINWKERHYS
jgi:cellulose synthase/poly-beta-1,6-N-acetylglucosamine synthase-like glycosyltransferase